MGRGLAEHVRGAEPAPPGPARRLARPGRSRSRHARLGLCLPWSTSSGNATTCCIAEHVRLAPVITRVRPLGGGSRNAQATSVSARPDRSPEVARTAHARRPGRRQTAWNWSWGAPGGFPQVVSKQERHPPNANHPTSQEAARGHGAALLGLVALGIGTGANADPRSAATGTARPAQRELRPADLPTDRAAVYEGTPDNPLVRPWGVYQGLAEMAWLPYLGATREPEGPARQDHPAPQGDLVRPLAAATTTSATASRSTSSSPPAATPSVLVQVSIFRMGRGSDEACKRLPTRGRAGVVQDAGSTASPRAWATPTWRSSCSRTARSPCARPAGSKLPLHLIRYGVRTLSALPNTSVYIDAGAADWQRDDPKKALRMLVPMGVRCARGFALNSTHYDSTERQIRHSRRRSPRRWPSAACPASTASSTPSSNGRPFKGYKYKGSNFDQRAGLCTSVADQAVRDPRHPADRRRGRPEVGDELDTTAGSPSGTSTPTCGSAGPGSTTRPRRSCWTGP